jgi:uncharacterized membrane protein
MAISAVAMAIVYIALAHRDRARRRDGLRLLVEAFAALGLVFATLAIPLAVDARWTSPTWRSRAPRSRGSACGSGGFALRHVRLAAAARGGVRVPARRGARVDDDHDGGHGRLLDSRFVGSLLIAVAGIFTAWRYDAEAAGAQARESAVAPIMLAWGLAWWLAAERRRSSASRRATHARRVARRMAGLHRRAAARSRAETALRFPAWRARRPSRSCRCCS